MLWASLAFASVPTISTIRSVAAEVGGILYAREAILVSTRRLKAESRSRVRTWLKGGESMRSDVSSMRRRREGDVRPGSSRGPVMPDAWRT